MKTLKEWEKLDLAKYDEGEIVCCSCGNSNTEAINPAFAFFQYDAKYSGKADYEDETVLCQTCLEADGILK